MERIHLFIAGRVQGVAFRWATQNAARSYGLCGWVKNMPDGRVEAMAEGERKILEIFKKWCHKGPPPSRVDNIECEWLEATGKFKDFNIKY